MKKIVKLFSIIFIMMFIGIFSNKVNALSLDAINIDTNKSIVNPGTEVTLTINFGKSLGAYTFDIAYDNSLLEFVSASDGTPSDQGTKVRVVYYDSSGGSNTKDSLTVTFKAKEGITTSNPTDLSVTAEGLANGDASEEYDDIVVPITKNITVEPDYKNYELDLQYSGNIVENEEKEITITTKSEMGRYYDHARLLAEVSTSTGGTVTLIGIDEQQAKHDLIQSGWGDPSGYKIGGKVNQVLKFTGLFTKAGDYKITLKLIDRDTSDSSIVEKAFDIKVGEKQTSNNNGNNNNTVNGGGTVNNTNNNTNNNTINNPTNNVTNKTNNTEKLPEELPKTGIDYISIGIIMTVLIISTIYVIKNQKRK